MTCPLEEQVLRLGTGAVGREEAARLESHARRCEDCLRAVHLISRTAAVLRDAPSEPKPDEVRRIEQSLVAWHRRRAAWRPVRVVFAWSAAAAAVVAVASGLSIAFDQSRGVPAAVRDTSREAPREDSHKNLYHASRDKALEAPRDELATAPASVARFPASTKVHAGRARVVTGSEAALAFQSGPELSVLELRDGHIAIAIDELASAESFVVATPDVRIEVVGATFQVKAGAGGTAVYVDEGSVRVKLPEHGAVERTLRKGERLLVSPAREKAVSAADAVNTPNTPSSANARSSANTPNPASAREPQRPPPAAEVVALMSDADAARRRGELETALSHYRRAADHPRAGSYVEEALLRAARIEVAAGRPEQATRDLSRAARLFPRGTLQPERAALSASIARAAGRTGDALRIIEALPHDARSMSLAEERLALARALSSSDPIAARRLIQPLTEGGPGPAIRHAARELMVELDAKK